MGKRQKLLQLPRLSQRRSRNPNQPVTQRVHPKAKAKMIRQSQIPKERVPRVMERPRQSRSLMRLAYLVSFGLKEHATAGAHAPSIITRKLLPKQQPQRVLQIQRVVHQGVVKFHRGSQGNCGHSCCRVGVQGVGCEGSSALNFSILEGSLADLFRF